MDKQDALQKIEELEKYIQEALQDIEELKKYTQKPNITDDMIVPGAFFGFIKENGEIHDEHITLIYDLVGDEWFMGGCNKSQYILYNHLAMSKKETIQFLNKSHIFLGVKKSQ